MWEIFGVPPLYALIADVLTLFVGLIFLVALVFYRSKYGTWIRAGACDHIVVAIGRDREARILCAQKRQGLFLDLGPYGVVPMDPQATYVVHNAKTRNSISFMYLPYALLQRAPEMAAVSKLSRGGEVEEARTYRLVDNDGKTVAECRPGGDLDACKKNLESMGDGKVVEASTAVVRLEEPQLIRVQDIEDWQVYSFNPVLLKGMAESYVVSELGRLEELLSSVWVKLIPIAVILSFVAFAVAIFT